jgi:hypothetical protein
MLSDLCHDILNTFGSYLISNHLRRIQNMTDATVEAQLKQLDVEMAKAKTQGEKDMIKERQAELKRQLEGSKKK